MRFIRKTSAPPLLTKWRETQGTLGLNQHYDNLDPDEKGAIRKSLEREQRGLCAYTGIRIQEGNFHIEHIKPQKICTDQETTDYSNLVGAAANPNNLPYGANAKDQWHDPSSFISPLAENCEHQFKFDQFGKMRAATEGNVPAETTISKLALDHPQLEDLRKAQIEEWLFGDSNEISINESLKTLEAANGNVDGTTLVEFEFAIRSAAKHLLA